MTIGILAVGPNAGLAVFKALAAAERVATGAIGGFAAFAAIGSDGRLMRAETQRGGTATLFTDGELTGAEPPQAVAAARMAAVMSSGPDRPAPLSQFVAGAAGVGLVTGHRLPNAAGHDGAPVNLQVLAHLAEGLSARQAVERAMTDNPEADAGIVACDFGGRVYASNSRRVAARPDLGHARREGPAGTVVEVLHNAILPAGALADLVCEIAMNVMVPVDHAAGTLIVRAGTRLHGGDTNRVVVTGGEVECVETTDKRLLSGSHNCAAIYLGAEVVSDGRLLGFTLTEPNAVVEDGHIVSLSGQQEVAIGYRGPVSTLTQSAELRASSKVAAETGEETHADRHQSDST